VKLRPIVIALLAITLLPAIAAASIVKRHTASGMALARGALLVRGELGAGWTASPAPHAVPTLTCTDFSPQLNGVTERGAAVSPTFSASRSGPFVSQAAYVYTTAAQAAAVWQRVVTPGLLRCVADSLRSGGSNGVTLAVTRERLLALPGLAGPHAGYRITGTATSPGQVVDVYVDMLVLARGDTVSEISASSFEQPPARELELRLARAVARRL
jgi:hypothetical protein